MSPEQFLDSLKRQGFMLSAEGDGIRIAPSSRLTDRLRETIRQNKQGLLAVLRGHHRHDANRLPSQTSTFVCEGGPCPHCRRPLDGKRRCWSCCDRKCACGHMTTSAFIEMCILCQFKPEDPPQPSLDDYAAVERAAIQGEASVTPSQLAAALAAWDTTDTQS